MELLFIPFIFVVVVLVIFGIISASRRNKELAEWAARNNLHFNPRSNSNIDDRYPDFDCLRQGHSRYANSLITGAWSAPDQSTSLNVCAFDYHYKTGSGKDESSHSFSAVIVENPIPMQPLLIRSENLFDRIADFFGAGDINFESAEFSRQFYVKSPDRRWAYDVIHQRMMELLLNSPRFNIQFAPRHVILWRHTDFKVPDFAAALRLAHGIFQNLPEYLVRRQTSPA